MRNSYKKTVNKTKQIPSVSRADSSQNPQSFGQLPSKGSQREPFLSPLFQGAPQKAVGVLKTITKTTRWIPVCTGMTP